MKRHETAEQLDYEFFGLCVGPPAVPRNRHMQMLKWQMYALHYLATEHCRPGGNILEIGTGFGTSAFMLAKARPLAHIESLTISEAEAAIADGFLHNMVGDYVQVLVRSSIEHYRTSRRPYDMILVDGDHKRCRADLPWFNRLRDGGLILFHDYSPEACPPVYEAVRALAINLRREPDIELIDTDGIGMAGFMRQGGETWPT